MVGFEIVSLIFPALCAVFLAGCICAGLGAVP
jgi:hypothetical protein